MKYRVPVRGDGRCTVECGSAAQHRFAFDSNNPKNNVLILERPVKIE